MEPACCDQRSLSQNRAMGRLVTSSHPGSSLIGRVLLALGMAVQERLVRGDGLGTCCSHFGIASTSDTCHVGFDASWCGIIWTSVGGWIDSAAAYPRDVRIFSPDVWLGLLSLMAWVSSSKIATDSSGSGNVCMLLIIELKLRDPRMFGVSGCWSLRRLSDWSKV